MGNCPPCPPTSGVSTFQIKVLLFPAFLSLNLRPLKCVWRASWITFSKGWTTSPKEQASESSLGKILDTFSLRIVWPSGTFWENILIQFIHHQTASRQLNLKEETKKISFNQKIMHFVSRKKKICHMSIKIRGISMSNRNV